MSETDLKSQLIAFGIDESTMLTINKTLGEVLHELVELRNGIPSVGVEGHRYLLKNQMKEFGFNEKSIPMIEKKLDEMLRQLAELRAGFPNGDFGAHRRTHEVWLKREEERSLIRRELISHLLKYTAWAAIVGIAIAGWQYFKILIGARL